MNIVAISDTHSQHDDVIIPPCDLLLHAGDLTFFSKKGKQEIIDFMNWFSLQPAKYKIFCGGNHDTILEMHESFFRTVIPPGVIYLNDESVVIDGIKIWGSPITPWFHDWAWNRQRGEKIKAHWDKIPNDTDIILTHGPVLGILDSGNGCADLLEAFKRVQPKIHVFGHIHVGYGHRTVNFNGKDVEFYNAALVNKEYKIINQPHLIKL